MIFYKDWFQPAHISQVRIILHSFIEFYYEHCDMVVFVRPLIKKKTHLLLIVHFSVWKNCIIKQPFGGLMPKIDAIKQEGLFKRILVFSL